MNLKNQFGRQIQYTTALIVGFVIIFMLTLTLAQSPKILAQSAPQGGTIPTIVPTEPPTATPASARLTIRKDAVPNDSQDFFYYGPFGLEFNLDDASPDDGDSFTDTFSIVVPPGSYNFSEAILANWDLTAINCTPSTGVVVDLPNTSVSITVNGGDDISCVFVNSQIVTPTNTPIESPTSTEEPTITPIFTDTPTETSTPSTTPTVVPSTTPTNTDTPTETPIASDTPTDVPSTTPTVIDTPSLTETPTLTETVTATALPSDTPSATHTTTATETSTATETNTSTPTNSATVPPSSTATGTSISGPSTSTPVSTAIAPTATPTSTRAKLIIQLDAQPNSIQNFNFASPFGSFTLDDSDPSDSDAFSDTITYSVVPGTYGFAEILPTFWHLSAINCTGGSTTINLAQRLVTITAAAGETVTCTFVNQRRVNIQVKKYNDLNGDGLLQTGEPFMNNWEIKLYTVAGTPLITKTIDSSNMTEFALRPPGAYKVCETQQNGWSNTTAGALDATINQPCYSVLMTPGSNATILFGNRQGAGGGTGEVQERNIEFSPLEDTDDPNTEDPDTFLNTKRIYLPVVAR